MTKLLPLACVCKRKEGDICKGEAEAGVKSLVSTRTPPLVTVMCGGDDLKQRVQTVKKKEHN